MSGETTFGAWLKQRRATLDLTREELAQQVGCALETVRKIERGARRPSKQIAERLAQALRLSPEERTHFIRLARSATADGVPMPLPVVSPGNTPPLPTPALVGRAVELARLVTLLADPLCRILTISGPGGVGKTHLAQAVAATYSTTMAERSAFVSLATLSRPDQIGTAIAEVLDVRLSDDDAIGRLVVALRATALLLVLDNAEHLLAGAPLLARLLDGLPRLRLLVTSRERLRLRGEYVFALDGLATPHEGLADGLERFGAVELFCRTARRTVPEFAPSPDELRVIGRICRLVAGLPLAIELAAPWARIATCAELAREIAVSLDFLHTASGDRTERQHSLRALFDHTWALLTSTEQTTFARLSVLHGSFERAAAEAVTGVSLQTLAALFDKSLVQRDGHGRFTLHDLARQYAAERLAALGETTLARTRHLLYYHALVERIEPALYGAQRNRYRQQLETEYDNLRAALEWALDSANDTANVPVWRVAGLRLVSVLWRFWYLSVYRREGRVWLERAIALLDTVAVPELVSAGLLVGASTLAISTGGDYKQAAARLDRGLALLRTLGDDRRVAYAAQERGGLALELGQLAEGAPLLEESLALYRRIGDQEGIVVVLARLAQLANDQGDPAGAVPLIDESVMLARALGDDLLLASMLNTAAQVATAQGDYVCATNNLEESLALYHTRRGRLATSWPLANLAWLAHVQGDYARAAQRYAQSLQVRHELGNIAGVIWAIEGLGQVAAARGCYQRAALLLGAAARQRMTIGAVRPTADEQARSEQAIALTRDALGQTRFATTWSASQSFTMEQVVAYALEGVASQSASACC